MISHWPDSYFVIFIGWITSEGLELEVGRISIHWRTAKTYSNLFECNVWWKFVHVELQQKCCRGFSKFRWLEVWNLLIIFIKITRHFFFSFGIPSDTLFPIKLLLKPDHVRSSADIQEINDTVPDLFKMFSMKLHGVMSEKEMTMCVETLLVFFQLYIHFRIIWIIWFRSICSAVPAYDILHVLVNAYILKIGLDLENSMAIIDQITENVFSLAKKRKSITYVTMRDFRYSFQWYSLFVRKFSRNREKNNLRIKFSPCSTITNNVKNSFLARMKNGDISEAEARIIRACFAFMGILNYSGVDVQ